MINNKAFKIIPLIFALIPEYLVNFSDNASVNIKAWIASGTNKNITDSNDTMEISRMTLLVLNFILCNKGNTNKIMEE